MLKKVMDDVDQVLERARREGSATEEARLVMLTHARRRQEAVLELNQDHGLSIRAIANALGCSASVIQKVVRNASRR